MAKQDADIIEVKASLSKLQSLARAFMSTHRSLSQKERLSKLHEIRELISQINKGRDQLRTVAFPTASRKFAVDAVRQSISTFMALWRKFELSLEKV